MPQLDPFALSAAQISRQVALGELTIAAVADLYSQRTEAYAKTLNTHLHWDQEDVSRQVAEQTARLHRGDVLPLAGVPVLIKDNICTKGLPTTCASHILKGYVPPFDATVVARLRQAGALIFGKTNLDEFGMGSSNENSAFGPVLNPWDRERVPGGSSGGSAAAVAAALAAVALGSDTGGSIRQPAAFCGITGLKPTYGRVSRYGLVAYSSSLDQIGPMARSTADLALLLDVISGDDPHDATSRKEAATAIYANVAARRDGRGLRLGVVREFFAAGLEGGTRSALEQAAAELKKLGASVQDVSLPSLSLSMSSYYLIATAEASANLARYDGVRYGARAGKAGQSLKEMLRASRGEGFGREVKQRIMLGTFALSSGYYDAYYAKATAARQLIAEDFAKAFAEVDLLIAPTAPGSAWRFGEKNRDPLAMYLSDICTLGVNLAGLPALSIPCGFDQAQLPVGMQLIGPAWSEELLLQTANLYERSCPWVQQHQPPLW